MSRKFKSLELYKHEWVVAASVDLTRPVDNNRYRMTPHLQTPGVITNGKDSMKDNNNLQTFVVGTDFSYKHKVVWRNAFAFSILHIFGLWGAYLLFSGGVQFITFFWTIFCAFLCGEGITIGAHRFYTHKSFKATPLIRAVLIILQTAAGQNSVFTWSRDHRLHHRYSDTDADPHNSKRGFFFSHMGWLMTKKHPYVKELGKKIDMSDLEADWMVMFQKKYYLPLYFLTAIIIPVSVPVQFFGETLKNAVLVCYFARYMILLNSTWLVNSAAHLYGTRPYDKNLQPVENWIVSAITSGEGWHNYHHAFPWDYKTAELSEHLNFSARIIEFLAKKGMIYDLKKASPDMVKNRVKRTGDGTHSKLGDEESKAAVKAFGPLHPLNPTYTVTYPNPDASLKVQGLPLYHENDILDFSNTTITKNVKQA